MGFCLAKQRIKNSAFLVLTRINFFLTCFFFFNVDANDNKNGGKGGSSDDNDDNDEDDGSDSGKNWRWVLAIAKALSHFPYIQTYIHAHTNANIGFLSYAKAIKLTNEIATATKKMSNVKLNSNNNRNAHVINKINIIRMRDEMSLI